MKWTYQEVNDFLDFSRYKKFHEQYESSNDLEYLNNLQRQLESDLDFLKEHLKATEYNQDSCEKGVKFLEGHNDWKQARRMRKKSRNYFDSIIFQYDMIDILKKHKKSLKAIMEKAKTIQSQEELKRREQRMFDLELEKQRLAQEHEMERLDKLLQIEEMKLIREREQRQTEQDQIDSLKETLRES